MTQLEYRRPTVAVVGAGAAGVAAAAECQLIGFDTTLIDDKPRVGGQYAADSPVHPPKKFGFRKGNLKHHRFTGSAESACEHLQAVVDFAKPTVKLKTRVMGAAFDKELAQWRVDVEPVGGAAGDAGENAQPEQLVVDVIIVATGTSSIGEMTGPNGRPFDLPGAYLHNSMEPIGIPNVLVMDEEEPVQSGFFGYPLDIVEAKADAAQRWVRQLEVHGPGALEVDVTYWLATAPTRAKVKSAMSTFSDRSHVFTPRQHLTTSSKRSQRSASKKEA